LKSLTIAIPRPAIEYKIGLLSQNYHGVFKIRISTSQKKYLSIAIKFETVGDICYWKNSQDKRKRYTLTK